MSKSVTNGTPELGLPQKRMTRRAVFKHVFRFSVLAALGFGYVRRDDLTTETVNLAFANLPRTFDGFRIVQISDLHASFWVGRPYLERVVAAVNGLSGDMVAVTGDLISGSVNDFWKRWLPTAGGKYVPLVTEVLRGVSAKKKLAVLGNHDHWDGKETEGRLVAGLETAGIAVLRNRSLAVERGSDRIFVAGTDDVWFTCNLPRALKAVPPEAFTILLSHSPDIRSDMTHSRQIELTLCGHTHGGQVAVPYLSHRFIPIKNPQRYLAGLVKEPYGYTYVNRGIGTLVFPLRIGAPPEITVITLHRA